MEDLLRESGLDWTVLRPPQLTGKPLTGRDRTAVGRDVRGGRSIPRADVAHYMLAVVGQPGNHRPGHRHRHLARTGTTSKETNPGDRAARKWHDQS